MIETVSDAMTHALSLLRTQRPWEELTDDHKTMFALAGEVTRLRALMDSVDTALIEARGRVNRALREGTLDQRLY